MGERAITDGDSGVRVWDAALRAFHWLLVACVAVSLLTGFFAPVTWLRVHLMSGTAIAALLGGRVVWGVYGGAYARFAGFAFAPAATLRHVRTLARGSAPRHLGHNPVGSVMIFALLGVLTILVVTGAVALGGVVKQGPLRAVATFAVGTQSLSIHTALAYLLAAMVAAHVAGVTAESRRTAENLAWSMVTGRKRAGGIGPEHERPARPLRAAAILLAGLGAGAGGIVALADLPARGVPPPTLDPTYALQCGACHLAYPPSFAPAATWTGILADLKDHFGADASLSPDQVAEIRRYLLANAAGHWDTLPAHGFRVTDPAQPLRLTATPFWRRMHRGIGDAVFNSPAVVRRSACGACHRDADTGRFAPQAIAVPSP